MEQNPAPCHRQHASQSEAAVALRERLDSGELMPVIDRTYTLDDIVEAFRYAETGQKVGKVVVLVV